MINDEWVAIGYLFSAALFIFGLKNLSHPRTAPRGNQLGAMGMLVAVLTTILQMELGEGIEGWILIGSGLFIGGLIGWIMAVRVEMTGMPELVALFNGFGGAASALVALSESWKYIEDESLELPTGLELEVMVVAAGLSALVGWMTLTGSLLAMLKLKGGVEIFGKWIRTPTWGPEWLNPIKAILFLGTLVLIVLAIDDPTNTDYLYAIIGIS
ncbi:NAD(P)(+) transhydrogenase (Re/Si-specific) subunit beta, partial [Candidatus Poseidoniales archaeon]|nr:NAD(P)(+) transhydrogenase (Re/Si-specific) subunit beta [Candidatus Poseidoniales archaeon]